MGKKGRNGSCTDNPSKRYSSKTVLFYELSKLTGLRPRRNSEESVDSISSVQSYSGHSEPDAQERWPRSGIVAPHSTTILVAQKSTTKKEVDRVLEDNFNPKSSDHYNQPEVQASREALLDKLEATCARNGGPSFLADSATISTVPSLHTLCLQQIARNIQAYDDPQDLQLFLTNNLDPASVTYVALAATRYNTWDDASLFATPSTTTPTNSCVSNDEACIGDNSIMLDTENAVLCSQSVSQHGLLSLLKSTSTSGMVALHAYDSWEDIVDADNNQDDIIAHANREEEVSYDTICSGISRDDAWAINRVVGVKNLYVLGTRLEYATFSYIKELFSLKTLVLHAVPIPINTVTIAQKKRTLQLNKNYAKFRVIPDKDTVVSRMRTAKLLPQQLPSSTIDNPYRGSPFYVPSSYSHSHSSINNGQNSSSCLNFSCGQLLTSLFLTPVGIESASDDTTYSNATDDTTFVSSAILHNGQGYVRGYENLQHIMFDHCNWNFNIESLLLFAVRLKSQKDNSCNNSGSSNGKSNLESLKSITIRGFCDHKCGGSPCNPPAMIPDSSSEEKRRRKACALFKEICNVDLYLHI